MYCVLCLPERVKRHPRIKRLCASPPPSMGMLLIFLVVAIENDEGQWATEALHLSL